MFPEIMPKKSDLPVAAQQEIVSPPKKQAFVMHKRPPEFRCT
jgi:hypothetical protein